MKRRHEETEQHGNRSKVTTLPLQSFTVSPVCVCRRDEESEHDEESEQHKCD